ncbi:MAG: hypothetical protein AAGK71_02110 [Pseudomonadota bacterium]
MAAGASIDDPFKVLSSERGVVRVFTTELDVEGSSAVTPGNVHRLLGSNLDLDESRIEVFPSTALDAMGLSLYLQEGYGIPEQDLRGVTAALDSLKGLIILVGSAAFKGQAQTLEPNVALRFVGLFREPAMAPPEKMSVPEAAKGPLGETVPNMPSETSRGSTWPIAVLMLLLVIALVLVLVF